MVKCNDETDYTIGESTTSIQAALDGILPKMLPLLCVLGVYSLLRRGLSTQKVLLIITIVGFVLGFFSII